MDSEKWHPEHMIVFELLISKSGTPGLYHRLALYPDGQSEICTSEGLEMIKGTCRLVHPISLRGNDMGKTYSALKAAPSGNSCFSVKEHLLMHNYKHNKLKGPGKGKTLSAPSTVNII